MKMLSRLAGHGLHLLREVDELALGHDLVGHGAGRLVEAGLHGPGVNAVGLDDRDELEGVGDAVAVGHEVVGGDAHENRHVVAAGLVNLVDDLAEEAGAVLGRSTVLVGTVIGVLGKEAHHHVADARVDLDNVDAGILAAADPCLWHTSAMRWKPGMNSSSQHPQAPVVVWYFGSVPKQSHT